MITKEEILQKIKENWELCVRECHEDTDSSTSLPHPFTVPCMKDSFQNLYYWDTYFTNRGLLKTGREDLAKSNILNFIYEIDRFGFIPNGNHPAMLNRSQPPYFAMMVMDYVKQYPEEELVREGFRAIKKEYDFWMTKRAFLGANRFYHHEEIRENVLGFAYAIAGRLQMDLSECTEEEVYSYGTHWLAEAESGWDFNPRFLGRCADFAPVDLNCQLYQYEVILAQLSARLGENAEMWQDKAEKRRQWIHAHMWDEEKGFFFDYDLVNEKRSPVGATAGFMALWCGVATDEQADRMVQYLPQLEFNAALSVCARTEGEERYQWAFPSAWPPCQNYVVHGLLKYFHKKEALAIAEKYIDMVTKAYQETGDLWEKYHAEDGSVVKGQEYETPKMMGWTAGTFADFMSLFH